MGIRDFFKTPLQRVKEEEEIKSMNTIINTYLSEKTVSDANATAHLQTELNHQVEEMKKQNKLKQERADLELKEKVKKIEEDTYDVRKKHIEKMISDRIHKLTELGRESEIDNDVIVRVYRKQYKELMN